MKILYLHQYFNTPDMKGGTRSYEMARRMVKAGHEVHMITSRKDGCIQNNGWLHENIDGINVHWLSVEYSNKMSYFRRLIAFFEFAIKAGGKVKQIGGDVIFATSTPLTIAIPAINAKKALKIPMVFEVRDLWPELPIAIGALKSPLTKYFAKKMEMWAYKNSDSIIGLSPGMCDGVIKTGYPESKVFNIPNSCDLELFNVDAGAGIEFRNHYEWLKKRPLIIYAGAYGHINGVPYLVQVAKEMLDINSDVRFLVVGAGVEESKIRDNAISLKVLNENFFMLPQITKKEMPALFSAATISTSLFVSMPEMWANSANKFFDTLAAGKPIAINYQGWQKEIIEDVGNGLVLDEFDYNKAAHQLARLISDESLLEATSKASFELANDRFSRDSLAAKLIEILEQVQNNFRG